LHDHRRFSLSFGSLRALSAALQRKIQRKITGQLAETQQLNSPKSIKGGKRKESKRTRARKPKTGNDSCIFQCWLAAFCTRFPLLLHFHPNPNSNPRQQEERVKPGERQEEEPQQEKKKQQQQQQQQQQKLQHCRRDVGVAAAPQLHQLAMNYNYSYNNNYICSSISPNSNNYKNNNEAREQVCTQQKFGYFLDPSVFQLDQCTQKN